MKLDGAIVVPLIIVIATLIVGWILAWGDIREYKKQVARLENDLTQEQDYTDSLAEKIFWLEKLQPRRELSDPMQRKKRINGAPAGDARSPQSESSSWQVQSYYASHPSRTGKNHKEASSGEAESKGWRERWS